jgi:hypothetical protein
MPGTSSTRLIPLFDQDVPRITASRPAEESRDRDFHVAIQALAIAADLDSQMSRING